MGYVRSAALPWHCGSTLLGLCLPESILVDFGHSDERVYHSGLVKPGPPSDSFIIPHGIIHHFFNGTIHDINVFGGVC
eukprot:803290-Pelagomonas_calceolata.AAC.2